MADLERVGYEYRVLWQREGQARKRAIYQTPQGAIACADRQASARAEMDWLPAPLPDLTYGPVIQHRIVGPWLELPATEGELVEEVTGA